jgi:hypothetical protein
VAAVAMNDALHGGEPDARAREFGRGMRVTAAHRRSAGGLFDPRGKLVGLTAFRIWDTEDMMRALSGEFIAAAMRRMRPVR